MPILKNTLSLSIALFCIFSLFPISTLHAQIPGVGEMIILKSNPALPGPNETVTLTAESFIIDINRADVTWSVNGRVVAEGTGVKQIEIQSGPLGKQLEIVVSVSGGIASGSASLTIIPTEITVLWNAKTYTPPFYRGKALPSPDSEIEFIALPHFVTASGQRLRGGNLLYTWKNDKKIAQQSSGYGRNTFSILGPTIFRTKRVDVEVSSLDGEYRGTAAVFLTASDPELLIYKKTPLLGVEFEYAIAENIQLAEEEITLTVYPLYFPIDGRDDQRLIFEWNVDGKRTADQRETITFRKEEGAAGRTSVSVLARLADTLFHRAQEGFSISLDRISTEPGF